MSVAQLASRIHTGSKSEPPLWLTQGFRPFFFAAAIWSIGTLVIWIAMLATGRALPSIFDPLSWHVHEMLFGFCMAAAAGFLLTAVPNWTKRPAVSGRVLASLVGLWLIGRLACAFSAFMPAWLGSGLDLVFPVALIAILAREIIASRNWRNLVMLAPLAVLAAADLLMHLEATGGHVPAGLGWRLGLGAMVVLMAVVGGRLIPTFTGNWLAKRDIALPMPVQHAWLTPASIAALSVGLLGWAALPDSQAFGAVLMIGGILNISKLARWRGLATGSEPLLFILHVAYLWMVVGVLLLGLATFDIVPQSAAIHALTAGAMGTMILAVMTRVARGHSGQSLTADTITRWIYGLVTLAAVFRVIAAFAAAPGPSLLLYAAAILWIAAYAVFIFAYSPTLLSKRNVG
ncbi:NnrS family protein [Methyloferula stellata]|uniref:NnrS family protein n=1 Tax=Methyloferula stellata TaxID=876270 RepID=UPI000376AF42|nr:NnrS family protein [Methyloferula stellata]